MDTKDKAKKKKSRAAKAPVKDLQIAKGRANKVKGGAGTYGPEEF